MLSEDDDPNFNIRFVMELREREPIVTTCALCELDVKDSDVPADTAMLVFWGATTSMAEKHKKKPRLGRQSHMICADMKSCMARIRDTNKKIAECHDKRIKHVLSHVVAPKIG